MPTPKRTASGARVRARIRSRAIEGNAIAVAATPDAEATLVELGGTAGRIGRELVAGLATVDELVAVTGLPVATVLGALTLLEDRGLVRGAYGRYRPSGALAVVEPVRRNANARR